MLCGRRQGTACDFIRQCRVGPDQRTSTKWQVFVIMRFFSQHGGAITRRLSTQVRALSGAVLSCIKAAIRNPVSLPAQIRESIKRSSAPLLLPSSGAVHQAAQSCVAAGTDRAEFRGGCRNGSGPSVTSEQLQQRWWPAAQLQQVGASNGLQPAHSFALHPFTDMQMQISGGTMLQRGLSGR